METKLSAIDVAAVLNSAESFRRKSSGIARTRRSAARCEDVFRQTARVSAADAITNAANRKQSFSISDVLNEHGKATAHYAAAVDDILQRAEKAEAIRVVGLTVVVTDEDTLCEVAYRGLPR